MCQALFVAMLAYAVSVRLLSADVCSAVSPVSFFIFMIYVLSLLPSSVLLEIYFIDFSFKELAFSFYFLFSISLISAIFTIFFLVPALSLCCSSFSRFLMQKLRLRYFLLCFDINI